MVHSWITHHNASKVAMKRGAYLSVDKYAPDRRHSGNLHPVVAQAAGPQAAIFISASIGISSLLSTANR